MTNKFKPFLYVLLGIICVIFIHNFNQNPQEKYASKGDYYFKKNNMVMAQKYYEKAFDAGLKSYKHRNQYVDTIIKSPITSVSQEKLAKILESGIDDSAKMRVEIFFDDLKKDIHKNYPQNFIEQAPYNQKIIRWSTKPITYGFLVQDGAQVPEYFKAEIEKAFSVWEKETERQIEFEHVNKNPNILIKFMPNNPADNKNQKYVVAYTVPTFSGNLLKRMTINFYTQNPNKEYFSQNQIYNTALHEIAHGLGFMGHSYNKEDIIYMSKDSVAEHQDLRDNLTKADINTLKLLYNTKPDISNVQKPDGTYLPQLVIGSSQKILDVKTKEAKNYINKAPKISGGYIDLASTYMNKNEPSKAIFYLEKALELADTDTVRAMVYYNLAVVYASIDHRALAKEYLIKSQQIKDCAEIHYLLADIYTREKDTKAAIAEYRWLLNKDPKNIEYVIGLTNIYVTEKQFFKARNVLKKYFELCPSERNNERLAPYGIIKAFL